MEPTLLGLCLLGSIVLVIAAVAVGVSGRAPALVLSILVASAVLVAGAAVLSVTGA